MTAKQPLKPRAAKPRSAFPIAGIGASAGGLEAFTQLLEHFPTDAGIALVLVQHLAPDHKSELTRLLARVTTMPVQEVTNNLRVAPNRVYVIPPDVNIVIVNGVLKLEPQPRDRRPQHAIDYFFESLAQDQRERAIGVVLSGTGADGTAGLEAIKAEGGITFAQDGSAKYDSMPRSAVAAGCVDFTLSPAAIGQELARISRHPYLLGETPEAVLPETQAAAARGVEREREAAVAHQGDASALPSGGRTASAADAMHARTEAGRSSARLQDEGFKNILLQLRSHCGVDFSLYKSTTIQRRIARRMVLSKHDTFTDYARFLRGNAKELDTLFSDVLISVTSFFRNPDAFDVLKRVVFPQLLKQRGEGVVRVWVLGCSTGQEAYSVAMAYAECAQSVPQAPKLQIFATDLNDALLDKARAGLYAKSIEADLSPERLRRFFAEEEGGYRVIKPLRDAVVFARQNVVSDPPFSRMDLVCCRNLLIYLEPVLQRKLIPMFHYALKPEGFLFLGASETVGTFHDLFEPVDRKQKIFAKKAALTPAQHLPAARARPAQRRRSVALPPAFPERLPNELSAQREADRLMVNEFAPPGVIVNAELQVMQFRGTTADYLAPPRGKASFDVLKMARAGLMLPLRSAINKAKKESQSVRKSGVRVEGNGRVHTVDIQVVPLKNVKERAYLILFEPAAPAGVKAASAHDRHEPTAEPAAGGRADMRRLRRQLADAERELAETRDYLQAIQEQQEAATEELQASSEEAQSANEELQSINEELETSKEELESTNEELLTVNEEMASRNAELNRLNADLNNLHVNIHTAILVVGRDLTLRRFTPLAEKSFSLLAVDLGRPLRSIRHALYTPAEAAATPGALGSLLDLESFVREVIDTVSVRERDVRTEEGRWYSLRVRPYMTLENKIDGAVIALIDIDALKRSEQDAAGARSFAEATIRAVRDPLVVLDATLRVRTANTAFYETFAVEPRETEGRLLYELGNGQWNIPALRSLLEDVLSRSNAFDGFEVNHEFERIGRRTMLLNGRRLVTAPSTPDAILLGIGDVTERKRVEADARQASTRFRLLAETVPAKIFTAEPGGERDYFNQQWLDYAGLPLEQLRGWGWTNLIHPDDVAGCLQTWKRCVATGEQYDLEQRYRRHDGQYRWHFSRAQALKDTDGRILMWVGSSIDVHDIKESDRRKDEFLAMLAHELRNPLAPLTNAIQILRQRRDAAATDSALDIMARQVNQMARLIDELLDVSRISRGRIDLHRQQIELAPVVNQAVEAARPHIERMEQELTVLMPPQPVGLNADPTRLAQVIGNLLNNASKFTSRGGRIRLTIAREGDQAVVRVQDNGIGIDAAQLEHVFDMFMQADTSLERSEHGLGIGLTLAKRLVELHDGTIEAHSEGLARGSEFVVRLPLSVLPAPASESSEPPVLSPARRRVLIVDDNVDAAATLAMGLEMSGHDVHIAHDGLEALEAAERLQPEVILLDIGLPKLNGYEVVRRMRQQRHVPGLLIIALTGWGQEDDKRRSHEAGFDLHFVKPISLAELEHILASAPG